MNTTEIDNAMQFQFLTEAEARRFARAFVDGSLPWWQRCGSAHAGAAMNATEITDNAMLDWLEERIREDMLDDLFPVWVHARRRGATRQEARDICLRTLGRKAKKAKRETSRVNVFSALSFDDGKLVLNPTQHPIL